MTKAWDIPFKDDFLVYHKHTFAKAPASRVSRVVRQADEEV